jgi:drug/metabolite transporter (DMT)-like permease
MSVKEGSYKPYSEVVISSIIYGSMGVFLNKIQNMSIESIIFSISFFGLGMIFIYLLFRRGLDQLRFRKNRRYLILLGLLNAITGICYFSSIKYSGMSVAVLLLYTAPVYVNLLAPAILGEKNSRKSLFPLLLAVTGLLLIARPGEVLMNVGTGSNFQKGLIFGLLAGLSFGTNIIMVRYLRHDYTGITLTFWVTFISLLIMLPSALFTPLPLFIENLNILMVFGFIITFASVVYVRGISGINAQTGSTLALLEPVSGIFFDITILKNTIYISTLLGCCLIITAAYIASRRDRSNE